MDILLDLKLEMGTNGLLNYNPVDRWFGESVAGVTVNSDCFMPDYSNPHHPKVSLLAYPYHFLKVHYSYSTMYVTLYVL